MNLEALLLILLVHMFPEAQRLQQHMSRSILGTHIPGCLWSLRFSYYVYQPVWGLTFGIAGFSCLGHSLTFHLFSFSIPFSSQHKGLKNLGNVVKHDFWVSTESWSVMITFFGLPLSLFFFPGGVLVVQWISYWKAQINGPLKIPVPHQQCGGVNMIMLFG